jgi:hypothetical protein
VVFWPAYIHITIEKKAEREKLASKAAQVASQTDAMEQRLGCVVEGVDKGQILVRMSKIDPSDPEREYTFVLDVSDSSYRGEFSFNSKGGFLPQPWSVCSPHIHSIARYAPHFGRAPTRVQRCPGFY